MAQIRPKILLGYGRINQPIRVPISDLLLHPTYQTFITYAAEAGDTTIAVQNLTGFADNQIIIIGDPGNQTSEIATINGSPSNLTITLDSALTYDHVGNTPVYVLPFDEVIIYHAATETGVKSAIATLDIVADNPTTNYNDRTYTSGYYFARFQNSLTTELSTYSEPAPVDGYTQFSARSVIDNALGMINKKTSEVLSDQFAFQQIDSCQMECLREFKRWSFMQSFDTNIGETAIGTWKIALPADCDDQNTNKSLYNFRIGKEQDMYWIDKEEWNAVIQGIGYSTLSQDETAGASTLHLTDSSDFDDSGTIQVGEEQYTYTANNKTTNVLTLDGVTTANYSENQDVFQFASLGYPVYWTIYDGYIRHWPITGSPYGERTYYLDYYKKLTQTTRDSQNIVLPDPTVVEYYLAWKFLLKLNNGEANDATNSMLNLYIARREKMKQKESLNRNFILDPNIVDDYGWNN